MQSKPGDEPRVRAGFSTRLLRRQALAANLAGDRIRCPEAFSEHTTQVEDEAQSEPRVREAEPLEGRLRLIRTFPCGSPTPSAPGLPRQYRATCRRASPARSGQT